jgi:hypothetical protein
MQNCEIQNKIYYKSITSFITFRAQCSYSVANRGIKSQILGFFRQNLAVGILFHLFGGSFWGKSDIFESLENADKINYFRGFFSEF